MSTTANLIEQADALNGCAQITREVYGPEYTKGVDIGRSLSEHAQKQEIRGFRPPIFALLPEHDRGESAGFKIYFGVPPELPIEVVGEVLSSRYGFEVEFVEVATIEELLPEEGFMVDNDRNEVRLPAVRVCPVLTASETA